MLRDGRVAFSGPLSTLSADDLHKLITGVAVRMNRRPAAAAKSAGGKAVLEVMDVSSQRLTNVTLTVQRGEVVGVHRVNWLGWSELRTNCRWPAVADWGARCALAANRSIWRSRRVADRLHPARSARGSLSRSIGPRRISRSPLPSV